MAKLIISRDGADKKSGMRNGFLWMALSGVGQHVVKLMALALLARILLPEDFGLASAVITNFLFFAVINESFIPIAVVRSNTKLQSELDNSYTLALAIGFITCGASILLAAPYESLLKIPGIAELIVLISPLHVAIAAFSVDTASNVRDMKFRYIAKTEFAAEVFGSLLITFTLALLGFGAKAIILGFIIGSLLRVIAARFITRKRYRLRWSNSYARQVLSFGGGVLLGRWFNLAANQGDKLVVARFLGVTSLGLYDRSYQLMKYPATLYARVVDGVFFAGLARIREDRQLGRNYYRMITELTMIFGSFAGVSIFFFSDLIVAILLGPLWAGVIVPLKALAFGTPFRLGYKAGTVVLRVEGKVYLNVFLQILYAGVVIVGCIYLSDLGLLGIGAAVSGAVTIHYLLLTLCAARQLEVPYLEIFRWHSPGFVISLISLSVFYFFDIVVPFESLLGRTATLFISVSTAGIIYIFWIILVPERLLGDVEKLAKGGNFFKRQIAH